MRAKFTCTSVTNYGSNEEITLNAVSSGSAENESFSMYTPSAELKMNISNPDVRGFFKPDKEYYLDFTEAE